VFFLYLKFILALPIYHDVFFYWFLTQVVSAMVGNDLMSFVSTWPLNAWKETLALLCTVRVVVDYVMLLIFS
jgi:hypothetical protein